MNRRTAALALAAASLLVGTGLAASPVYASSPATFAVYPAPTSLLGADQGGEPSVGLNWRTGAILVRSVNDTYRVRLDATGNAAWDVTDQTLTTNFDPILFTDSALGRTWTGGEVAFCNEMSYSDDDVTWSPTVNSCAGFDHETIGAGPFAPGLPATPQYDHAVYYCAHAETDLCAVSVDGGRTFAPPVSAGTCWAGTGHVKVSADGTAYVPNARCGSLVTGTTPGGAVSTNNGVTWGTYAIPGASAATGFGYDPTVATTPDNTVYESWISPSGRLMVARSSNHGTTWSAVTDLSSTGAPVNAVFPAAVAGRDGAVAVAYLGSTTPGAANQTTWHGSWDLYVTTTLDGGATWTTSKVTSDPVQRGSICTAGASCATNRNLLDFIDAQRTQDGRVVIAYADGCVDACAAADGTEAQSTSARTTLAVQNGGSLLE